MLELILFICVLPIVVVILFGVIGYYNLKRRLGGLPYLSGPDALAEFLREVRKDKQSAMEKQKGQTDTTKNVSSTTEFEDAEFREKE